MQAINKHGFVKGVIMTADRLIHEADEKKWTKQILRCGNIKYTDPVDNNDFWWYRQ
jgi:hypothetical protein